eukprot:GHUV01006325.1.p1 GENE.GHUV01006325.1~~GHUV01006325.1.p1  ORF type:complete len:761 (+),score=270.63 GHUV01006325.1:349-2631(+)
MGNSQSSGMPALQLSDPGKELLKSAERGETNVVALAIACNPLYLSHTSVFGGNTMWHKAAKTGKVEIFEALEQVLKQAFELEAKDLSNSRGSIRRLGSSSADVIRRMVNKANLKGVTPLMLACAGSHTEAVAWLLKNGADVWKHDRIRRHTALHCAAQAGATDAIRLVLVRAGTDVDPGNDRTLLEQGNHAGLTALHYAVYSDRLEVVQQLIAHNADIAAQAEFPDLDWASVNAGDTVMHIAASKGNIEMIQILLRAYNEMSGAIVPDTGLPRRVRDPRVMRNDYGRLPYHLAIRKGFTWLAELLDPSVPVRYLLAGEQLDTGTNWGPPRLAIIAAAVLHKSLVTDLSNIRELEKAEQAATQQAAGGPKTSAAPDKVTVRLDVDAILADCCSPHAEAQSPAHPEQQEQQPLPASPRQQHQQQSGESSGQGPVPSDNNAASGSQKRRWTLTGQHRRSLSGGRSSLRAAATEQAGPRPPSRKSLGSRAHSRRGSRGQGEFGPPPSPLSPRMLMSVVLGGATSSQEQQGHAQDDKGVDKDVESLPVTPKSHSVFPELPFLLSPSSIAAVRDRCEAQQQVQLDLDPLQQLPESLAGCDSGSFCSLADADDYQQVAYWDEDLAVGAPIQPLVLSKAGSLSSRQEQQQEVQASTSSAGSAQQQAPGTSMLDSLFKQYTWSSCVKLRAHHACGDSLGEDSRTCGICLDEVPTARIVPCNHSVCAGCAQGMIERFSLSTAVCPFCRCIIRGFGPANLATLSATPAEQQ